MIKAFCNGLWHIQTDLNSAILIAIFRFCNFSYYHVIFLFLDKIIRGFISPCYPKWSLLWHCLHWFEHNKKRLNETFHSTGHLTTIAFYLMYITVLSRKRYLKREEIIIVSIKWCLIILCTCTMLFWLIFHDIPVFWI